MKRHILFEKFHITPCFSSSENLVGWRVCHLTRGGTLGTRLDIIGRTTTRISLNNTITTLSLHLVELTQGLQNQFWYSYRYHVGIMQVLVRHIESIHPCTEYQFGTNTAQYALNMAVQLNQQSKPWVKYWLFFATRSIFGMVTLPQDPSPS